MDGQAPMTEAEFQQQVDRVRDAIKHGLHPRLNAKGSSGSCWRPLSFFFLTAAHIDSDLESQTSAKTVMEISLGGWLVRSLCDTC